MDLHTETDISLALLFEERTEDPCEHSGHSDPNYSHLHGGNGEWLIRAHARCCRSVAIELLVCNTFKYRVVDHIDLGTLLCSTCKRPLENQHDYYTVLGRKGVDF